VLDALDQLKKNPNKKFFDTNGDQIDVSLLDPSMGLKGMQIWNEDKDKYEIRWEPWSPNQATVTVGNEVFAVSPMDKSKLPAGAGVALGVHNVPTTTVRTEPGITMEGEIGPVTKTAGKTPMTVGIAGRTAGGAPVAPSGGAVSVTGQGSTVPQARAGGGAAGPVTGAGFPVARSGGGYAQGSAIPFGAANQLNQRIVPVREAGNQLFGDPTQPGFKSMKDYGHLADDPAARERLGKAFKITFDGLQSMEKREGGLWNLIQTYAGMPQALAAAQQNVREDVIGTLKDHPEEMDAYDTAINAYGSQVGMRAINKGTATNLSIEKLENELPLIGLSAMNQRQYYNKMGRLAENLHGAFRTVPLSKAEKQYFDSQVKEMDRRSGAAPSAGGLPAPPSAKAAPTNRPPLSSFEHQ
jgi:hypothetical protein